MAEDKYHALYKKAERKIKNLQRGEVFELKDLFDILEWNALEGKRSSFGRYFAEKVRNGEIEMIEEVPQKKKTATKYKKIK